MRDIPSSEKLDLIRISVNWIQNKDIMDSCFILNFGYEASLSWPQVQVNDLFEILMMPSKGIYDIGK